MRFRKRGRRITCRCNVIFRAGHRLFALRSLRIDQPLDLVDQRRKILQAERNVLQHEDIPDAGERCLQHRHMLARRRQDLRRCIRYRVRQHSRWEFLLACARLDFAGCDHPGPVGHRANSAPLAQWCILQREYDGRQLKRAKRGDTRAKVAVSGTWMDIVPEFIQPLRNRSNAHREASEISIQDRQPRPYGEQSQVSGALPQ